MFRLVQSTFPGKDTLLEEKERNLWTSIANDG